MKKKKQILIIPLTFWSGIEQGFFGADFTAVSGLADSSGCSYSDFYFRALSHVPMEFILLEEFLLSLGFVMPYLLLGLASSSKKLAAFQFSFLEL